LREIYPRVQASDLSVVCCSTAEALRGKIPEVEKDLKKSENELANMVTQENKVANEVRSICSSSGSGSGST